MKEVFDSSIKYMVQSFSNNRELQKFLNSGIAELYDPILLSECSSLMTVVFKRK